MPPVSEGHSFTITWPAVEQSLFGVQIGHWGRCYVRSSL